ncbi:amino acid ABC transporter permease [Paraburkholderia sp. LEh10]|uniref:amino acid ABC transporter permease n=1 Tax=Paraburkholderia sp. LEh10 TaxID=2821353 RepID=UPI001AE23853|nr:amino acid ABC transporter permease [Paraburkholderia sp. LEh10]MBP0590268.1 amino acid ABC transporter permease [Paraburkholderia sp. LEh10]
MPTFNLSMLLSGQYHQWLVSGFAMSIKLSVLAFALSLPLAIGVALIRLAPLAFIRGIGQAYVESIRNVPLLAHMLFWYFGAPQLLPLSVKTWLYNSNFEAASALIALLLYTSAYMSEDIRSGIRSIPKEQLEASRALGFGFLRAMWLVVLPQSLRVTVPPLVNQTLNLWKNSSIAMVIGVAELMYQAQQVESATFRGFESFAFATAAYLTVSIAITVFSAWYQHRFPVRTI